MVAYSYKARFIAPVCVGLGIPIPVWIPKVAAGLPIKPKRHTIRAHGKRRHARPGEELQHYYGMRTRQCQLIGRATCSAVKEIELWIGTGDEMGVQIDDNYFCGSTDVREFAQADGFSDAKDMVEFWRSNHPGVDHFKGAMIEWEPIA